MENRIRSATPAQRLDSLARTIALGLLFITPIIALPTALVPLGAVKQITLAFLAAVPLLLWALARYREGSVTVAKTWLWGAIGLLLFVYLISALLAPEVTLSLTSFALPGESFLSVVLLFALFANGALLFSSVASQIRFIDVLFAAFGVATFIQLLRLLVGAQNLLPALFTANPNVTLLGNMSDLAVLAGLVLFVATVLLSVFAHRRWQIIFYGTVAALALLVLLLANITSVWVMLAIITFVFFLYLFSTKQPSFSQEKPSWRIFLPLAVFLVSFAMIFMGGFAAGILGKVLSVQYVDVRPSWSGTVEVLKSAYQEKGAWLFGTGPGTFAKQWAAYRPAGVNLTAFWNIDFNSGIGFVPTAFVTVGLLGGLLWLAVLGWLVYLGFRILWVRLPNEVTRALAAALAGGVVYGVVMLLVYVPQAVLLGLLFMFFGLLVAFARNVTVLPTFHLEAKDPRSKFIRDVLLAKTTVFAVLLLLVPSAQACAMSYLQRTLQYAQEGELTVVKERLETLKALPANWIIRKANIYILLAQANMAQAAELLAKQKELSDEDKARLQTLLQDAVAAAQKAAEADPTNYNSFFFLGTLYEEMTALQVEGAYEAAIAAYDRALALAPGNPKVAFAKARAAFKADKLDDARTFAAEALKYKPNYTDAYFLLSQIAVKSNKLDEAIAATESAVVLTPNNPGLLFQLGVLQYSAKNYQKAAAVLRRAVQLNPQYANALYYLALADIKLGNKQEALAALKQVLKTNPDAEQVKELIATLEKGKEAEVPEEEPKAETPVKEKEE